LNINEQQERRMLEKRRVKRRRYKAYTYFPAINHQGNFIMSERRDCPTRRVFDVFVENVDDVDLPTMTKNPQKTNSSFLKLACLYARALDFTLNKPGYPV
jgi:hypothetical protein